MTRPRVGFLGIGWIGRHRLEAMVATAAIEPIAICDPSAEMRQAVARLVPEARAVDTLDEMLALDPDGIVIATPSALHAAQAIRCLETGVAVFCQKPLGRDAGEVRAAVAAAQAANRLLAVDLSYRQTEGMRQIRKLVVDGTLGRLFAIDLTFHNAYGPDKAWFYSKAEAGGGCLADLGVHLVDLALWVTDFPSVANVSQATILHAGMPMTAADPGVEDYAAATISLVGGPTIRVACSWRLNAGEEAKIEAAFYGTQGGAALRNVDGSFYDFEAHLYLGTKRQTLTTPPDAWGGRAAAEWALRLAKDATFDRQAEQLIPLSEIIDAIYVQASRTSIDLPHV